MDDTRIPLSDWLDAIYVILLESADRAEHMKRLDSQLDVIAVQVDPKRARDTWGTEPLQAEAAARLERQGGPPT